VLLFLYLLPMREGWIIQRETKLRHCLTGVTMIGRLVSSGISIMDPSVSRRHAMIRQQDDGFWYFDLGSFNGSYINERRVVAAVKLKSGDHLHIAGHDYDFEEPISDAASDFSGDLTVAKFRTSQAIVLVTDIMGFTRLSESLEPAALAQVIGSWYSFTEEILFRHGATLDKFVGDCALAYWTDIGIENRVQALRAAVAIQQACNDTYEAHQDALDKAGQSFGSCAAIHIGKVAYGGLSRSEFTLVGDAVNVTFRVESLTRSLQQRVLVTGEFLNGWEQGHTYCRSLGPQSVKGRSEAVTVYALEDIPSTVG
jgi:adenylate cyclase